MYEMREVPFDFTPGRFAKGVDFAMGRSERENEAMREYSSVGRRA